MEDLTEIAKAIIRREYRGHYRRWKSAQPKRHCGESGFSKYVWRTCEFLLIATRSLKFMPGSAIRRELLLSALFLVFLLGRAFGQEFTGSVEAAAGPTPSIAYKNQSAQQITDLILEGYERWNARDLDGYMEMFWRSPDLVYAVDNEVTWGWADLRAELLRGYPDRSAMGVAASERLEIRVLTADFATAVNTWSMQFPKVKVLGTSVVTLRKFVEGWRIVCGHASSSEIPLN
jgi:hypothetical protein